MVITWLPYRQHVKNIGLSKKYQNHLVKTIFLVNLRCVYTGLQDTISTTFPIHKDYASIYTTIIIASGTIRVKTGSNIFLPSVTDWIIFIISLIIWYIFLCIQGSCSIYTTIIIASGTIRVKTGSSIFLPSVTGCILYFSFSLINKYFFPCTQGLRSIYTAIIIISETIRNFSFVLSS